MRPKPGRALSHSPLHDYYWFSSSVRVYFKVISTCGSYRTIYHNVMRLTYTLPVYFTIVTIASGGFLNICIYKFSYVFYLLSFHFLYCFRTSQVIFLLHWLSSKLFHYFANYIIYEVCSKNIANLCQILGENKIKFNVDCGIWSSYLGQKQRL